MVRANIFKQGDVVKFKAWEDMVDQYGLDATGSIKCPGKFTPEMRLLYCNDNAYTIREVEGTQVFFTEDVSHIITTYMLCLATDINKYNVFKRPKDTLYDLADLYGAISETYRNVFSNVSILTERAVTIMHMQVDTSDATIDWFKERIDKNPKVDYIMFIDKRLPFIDWEGDKGRYKNAWFFIGEPDMENLEYMISELLDPDTAQLFFDLRAREIENAVNKKLEAWARKSRAAELENARNELSQALAQGKTESLERELLDVNANLRATFEEYEKLLEKKNQLQKDILYATTFKDSEIEEFIEFLKNDESLLKMEVKEDLIFFDIRQELLYFDADEYKIFWEGKYRTPLCDAIFSGKARIIFTQRFALCPGRSSVHGYNTDGYMGNPHIAGYNCWDENQILIAKALAKRDYITAYMQAKSAIANVKVVDTTVIRHFDQCLNDKEKEEIKCIFLPGQEECVSIKEARRYFEKEA